MRRLLPEVASIRDFYAFEQHMATCRRHRRLDMVPEWYRVPVFYFSSAASVVGHKADVWSPRDSQALDYELELASVIGQPARDLPAADRAQVHAAYHSYRAALECSPHYGPALENLKRYCEQFGLDFHSKAINPCAR